jgi:hypothetical protein
MEWFAKILANKNATTLLVASFPIILTIFIWVLNQWMQTKRDNSLRREKMIDVMQALKAEIEYFLGANKRFEPGLKYATNNFDSWISKKTAGQDRYIPFIPSNQYDTVYLEFLSEIQILPEKTISPVVEFYSQISALQDLGSDMRTENFSKLDDDRRYLLFRDYLELNLSAMNEGRSAVDSLEKNIDINRRSQVYSQVSDGQTGFQVFEILLVITYFTILFIITLVFS